MPDPKLNQENAYDEPQAAPGEDIGWGSKVYQPRLTEPLKSNKNWIKNTKGGYSRCIIPSPVKGQKYSPSTLPNCVGYAWGRAYELCKQWNCKVPDFNFGNPPVMWRNSKIQKKWARGQTPRLGALAIWYKKNGKKDSSGRPLQGHIAVVEQLHYASNGRMDYFLISHSGYPTSSNSWGNPPKYTRWTTKKIYAKQNFRYSDNYPLMGFYYPPYVGLFSKDAGAAYADGQEDANGYCGMSLMTVYVLNPETGQYEPVQGTGNSSYDPEHPGLPDLPDVPPIPEATFKAGAKVKVVGIGNSSKLGIGKEVNCMGATYQIKSIHRGFPYMYRIGTETRGVGYFRESDLTLV